VERAAARLPPQCSHAEPFIHVPNLSRFASVRSAQRQSENYVPSGMQDGHRLCPDLPETFEA
jgi:hypothetical protein